MTLFSRIHSSILVTLLKELASHLCYHCVIPQCAYALSVLTEITELVTLYFISVFNALMTANNLALWLLGAPGVLLEISGMRTLAQNTPEPAAAFSVLLLI